jgi:hypothetical protein
MLKLCIWSFEEVTAAYTPILQHLLVAYNAAQNSAFVNRSLLWGVTPSHYPAEVANYL